MAIALKLFFFKRPGQPFHYPKSRILMLYFFFLSERAIDKT